MDSGGGYPFNAAGPTSARGRISVMSNVVGAQDVTMSDQAANHVAGTSADAELEELCNALPGWHHQHIVQAPVILGGLSRTVSAPSSFLLTASRLSPGFQANGTGVNISSNAQQKEVNSCGPSSLDDDGRAQPAALVRWLQQQQQPSNVNSAPLNTQYLSPQIGAGNSGVSLGSNTIPSERKPWGGPGAPDPSWSTLVPPGEQHTSAMLLSLYPEQMGCNETPGTEPVSFPPSQGCSLLKHTGIASRQPSQQPGAQVPGSGLSDWPSGGLMIGSSSGLQIVCGQPPSGPLSGPFFPATVLQSSASGEQVVLSAAAAAALSGPVSLASGAGVLPIQTSTLQLSSRSPDVPQHQHHQLRIGRCGKVEVPMREVRHPTSGDDMEAAEQEEEAETRTALDMDQDGTAHTHQSASSGSSMCPAVNGALPVAGPMCEATGHSDGGARPGGQSGTFVQVVEKVEPCPVAAVGPSVGGNMGMADTDATAPLGMSASVTGPGEVSSMLATTGQAVVQGCASGLAVRGGSGGGGAGSIRAGKSSAPASGSRSNSGNVQLVPETAPSEDGLQLLAMRFRNRPGRVPKAVAKLGPIAELAKNAATGKVKLEKDELDDLVMTVETSIAKAVTEQKEDSRARNRVAQQRFRNRQRETIAALQSKVEEQEALIAVLHNKIQLYEARQQHQPQQRKLDRSVKRSGSE